MSDKGQGKAQTTTDDRSSPVAVAAGVVIAGTANAAESVFGIFGRRRKKTASAQTANGTTAQLKTTPAKASAIAIAAEEDPDEIPVTVAKAPVLSVRVSATAEDDNDLIPVRVSTRASRASAKAARPKRRGLAEELLDGVVGQIGDYIESSPAAERLIRTQVDKVLTELAHDPQLATLIRAQAEDYLGELAAQPLQLDPLVNKVAGNYLANLRANPAPLNPLVGVLADSYVAQLQKDPAALDPLVRAVADRYLDTLKQDSATLMPLVQTLGNAYIDYLNQHPDAVQNLIQGQSLGMAEQVMDEVRERAATSDSLVELFARNLFHRAPREELPPPPVEVQRAAVRRAPFIPRVRRREEEID